LAQKAVGNGVGAIKQPARFWRINQPVRSTCRLPEFYDKTKFSFNFFPIFVFAKERSTVKLYADG